MHVHIVYPLLVLQSIVPHSQVKRVLHKLLQPTQDYMKEHHTCLAGDSSRLHSFTQLFRPLCSNTLSFLTLLQKAAHAAQHSAYVKGHAGAEP